MDRQINSPPQHLEGHNFVSLLQLYGPHSNINSIKWRHLPKQNTFKHAPPPMWSTVYLKEGCNSTTTTIIPDKTLASFSQHQGWQRLTAKVTPTRLRCSRRHDTSPVESVPAKALAFKEARGKREWVGEQVGGVWIHWEPYSPAGPERPTTSARRRRRTSSEAPLVVS